MITEDYVSFETAKLLKKKGFEPPHDYRKCLPIMYTDKGEIKWGVWSDDWYSRITLQMAMKWLREVHNIALNVCYLLGMWSYSVYRTDVSSSGYNSEDFDTYEEACEDGIRFCLENLI